MLPETPAHMLPGTALKSVEDLKVLPAYSVVLVRSHVQPYFRTAWTLTHMEEHGIRFWSSAGWRAELSDEDLFAGAKEAPVLLYRPDERFGIGPLNEAGWIPRDENEITVYATLPEATAALEAAVAADPRSAILQQISPGPWVVHGRP
jgi:hypothetical protein